MAGYPLKFGKDLLLERVNVGGMAEVFKAKTFGVAGFERILAIKRILPSLVEDEEFIQLSAILTITNRLEYRLKERQEFVFNEHTYFDRCALLFKELNLPYSDFIKNKNNLKQL